MVGKIYEAILVDSVRKVTEGLIDDEQVKFRAGRGCVGQIFILKHEKQKKNRSVCVFYELYGDGL